MTWEEFYNFDGSDAKIEAEGKKMYDRMVDWIKVQVKGLTEDMAKEDKDTSLNIRMADYEDWPKVLDNIYLSAIRSHMDNDDPNMIGFAITYGDKDNEEYPYTVINQIWQGTDKSLGMRNPQAIAVCLNTTMLDLLWQYYMTKAGIEAEQAE